MNFQHLSVYKIHEFVAGYPPSVEMFEDRIIARKIIYLAESLGAYSGDYKWNWYKKGPYSPALARVLFQDYDNSDYSTFDVREDLKIILEPLKELVKDKPNNLSKVDWLELLASFYFLYSKSISKNFNEVTNTLIGYKPKYTNNDVHLSYRKLQEYGII